jgi:hypothetical protein
MTWFGAAAILPQSGVCFAPPDVPLTTIGEENPDANAIPDPWLLAPLLPAITKAQAVVTTIQGKRVFIFNPFVSFQEPLYLRFPDL